MNAGLLPATKKWQFAGKKRQQKYKTQKKRKSKTALLLGYTFVKL